MIKNFKLFSESILWYKSGKFVKDDNFKLPERKYSPAEQWFLEQITDLEEVRSNKYPDSIFYKKNGEVLFEYNQKFKYFWVNYHKIWSFFKSKFGLNYQEIKDLIKGMVEGHLNLGEVTPYPVNSVLLDKVEGHLNLGEVTPNPGCFTNLVLVEGHLNLGEVTPRRASTLKNGWWRHI